MLKKKTQPRTGGRFPFPFLHTRTKANCKGLVFSFLALLGWPRSQKCQGNPSPAPNQPQTTVAAGNGGKLHSGFNSSAEPASSPLQHGEGGGGMLWGLKYCTASQSTSETVTPALTLSFTRPSFLALPNLILFPPIK